MKRMLFLQLFLLWVAVTGAELQRCCRDDGKVGEGEEGEEGEEEGARLLVQCVKEEGDGTLADARFILLSYSTKSIYSYAAYGHLINAAYAQSRGYGFSLAIADDGNYEPEDPRWNKVQIVLRALDTRLALVEDNSGESEGPVYLVWMDSDLVVLHHDLRLEDIVAAHPEAHLLLSRDPRPENGVANTGCFLARVSPFARNFLAQWWDAFGRLDGMDQHVFHRLWEVLPAEQHDWVALLPPSAINSDHPVWRRHTAESPVLHLVGMNSVVRREVFRGLARQLCDAVGDVGMLASTVRIDAEGLKAIVTNDTLRVTTEQALLQRAARLEKEAGSAGLLGGVNLSALLEAVEAVVGRARDMRQRGYGASRDEVAEGDRCRGRIGGGEGVAIQWSLFRTLERLSATQPSQSSLRLLQLHADVGMDLLATIGSSAEPRSREEFEARAVVDALLPLVDQLADLSEPAQRPHALYYKFKLLEHRARSGSGHSFAQQEIASLHSALAAWEEMSLLGWHGSGNSVLYPGREAALLRARLGSLLCNQPSASSRQQGARELEAAVGEMERAWASRSRSDVAAQPLPFVEATAQALLALTLCRLGQPEARNAHNRAVLLHRQWLQRLEQDYDPPSFSTSAAADVGKELARVALILGAPPRSTVYRKRKRRVAV